MTVENTNGFIVFRCHECGTRFLGPDKGEDDVLIYDPAVCPHCGHIEREAYNLFYLVSIEREAYNLFYLVREVKKRHSQ